MMSREWVKDTREAWARAANEALRRAGCGERIDHRKELKIKDLLKTAAERGKRDDNKTQPKPPDSLRQGASQAAGAAPTLRYGPAGDSPSATAQGGWYDRKVPFRPVHTARNPPFSS